MLQRNKNYDLDVFFQSFLYDVRESRSVDSPCIWFFYKESFRKVYLASSRRAAFYTDQLERIKKLLLLNVYWDLGI